jgi:hypothetical protein
MLQVGNAYPYGQDHIRRGHLVVRSGIREHCMAGFTTNDLTDEEDWSERYWGGPVGRNLGRPCGFRLTGFAHTPAVLHNKQQCMAQYYQFFGSISDFLRPDEENIWRTAAEWDKHIIPTPVLSDCAKMLMREEARLLGMGEYIELRSAKLQRDVLRMVEYDDANVYGDEDGTSNRTPAENENCRRREMVESEDPKNLYARCLSENCFHDILEKEVLHGNIGPDQLQADFGSKVQEHMAQQMNKLLTYQLIKRTIVRVNRRCVMFRQALQFPLVLEMLVSAFLGEAPRAPWHGASWDDMFHARVVVESSIARNATAVEAMESDGVLRYTLPLTNVHDQLGLVYVRQGEDYWKMPNW